jgi:hypothetical protein
MVEIEFPETIAAFRNNYRLLNLAQIAAPTSGETHSRHGGAWFMIAACWYGAPALAERQCKVSVTSGSNLPHGLPYEPIMLTAEEWARGGSGGTMSLATMRIDPL